MSNPILRFAIYKTMTVMALLTKMYVMAVAPVELYHPSLVTTLMMTVMGMLMKALPVADRGKVAMKASASVNVVMAVPQMTLSVLITYVYHVAFSMHVKARVKYAQLKAV
jgi:hypothetical protein